MAYSAHVDTFTRDNLPPPEQQPEFLFDLPELKFPERMNCATELLDRHVAAGRGGRLCIQAPNLRWTYADLQEKANRIANVLVNDLGIPSAKIDILYNGVDVGEALPARQFANGRSQTILFLGNLLERKGMSDFIAALGALPATADSWSTGPTTPSLPNAAWRSRSSTPSSSTWGCREWMVTNSCTACVGATTAVRCWC